MAFSDVIPGLW